MSDLCFNNENGIDIYYEPNFLMKKINKGTLNCY